MSKKMIERKYKYDKKFTRVLVISDSHSDISYAMGMIDIGRFDQIIHLGDLTDDAEDLMNVYPEMIIHSVKGNCDFYDTESPELLLLSINGTKIFACHGHQYGIKGSTDRVERAGRKRGAEIVLFGHSHRQQLYEGNGIILMNPGSIALPRGSKYPGCGILEIESNGKLHCNLHEISKKRKRF